MSELSPNRDSHPGLIANDWRRRQEFCVQVFDCVPVSTERDIKGPAFKALPGDGGGGVKGRQLRPPGHGEHGPTRAILQCRQHDPTPPPSLRRPGSAHLAGGVPDVAARRREVHAWGQRDVGKLVTREFPGAGRLMLVYVADPEGIVVELQRRFQSASLAP